MAIENSTRGIGNRIIVIIAIHEDGDDRRNRPGALSPRAGALQQTGQFGEDRCRIAAGDGRLAGGYRHFPDRMGKPGDAIDDEEDIVALIAEMLRNRHRHKRRHLAQHRALVTGGDDGNRLGHMLAKRVLDEFAHLATTLAHERDDNLVERICTRQHRQEGRLADPGAGEDAETLAEAKRREQIDRPHARHESLFHAAARHRRRRGIGD